MLRQRRRASGGVITLIGTTDVSSTRGEMSIEDVAGDAYWRGWLDVPNDVEDDDAIFVWVVSEVEYELGGKVIAPDGWELLSDDSHSGSHIRWRMYYRKASSEPGTYTWYFQALDKAEKYTAICAVVRPQDKNQPLEESSMGPVYTGVVNNLPLECADMGPPNNAAMYVALAYWCGGNNLHHGWSAEVENLVAVDGFDARRYLLFGTISNQPESSTLSPNTTSGGFTTGPINAGTMAYMLRGAYSQGELQEKFGTLGRATSSATGKVQIKGAATKALAAVSLSSLVDTPAKGTLTRTLSGLEVTAVAKAPAKGALSRTLDESTLIADGVLPIKASMASTLGPSTMAATGEVDIVGAISAELAPLALSSDADTPARGALSRTLAPATLAAAGKLPIKGAAARTLAPLARSIAGKGIGSAELAATLGALSSNSAAHTEASGFLAATLGEVTLAADADAAISGSADRTLSALELSASGGAVAFGELAATLADLTTAPTMDGAWAISTHAVRVVLSSEPRHVSEFDEGDALNPLTWRVVDQATGIAYTVVGVTMPDDTTIDLMLLEALGSHLQTFTVSAIGLIGGSGGLAPDLSASFVGTVQTLDPIAAVSLDRFLDRDLANPPLQSETSGFAGTLKIGADGDYDTEDGIALVRKLVLRRLSTPRGAFPHLPTYGLGIAEKELIPSAGSLVALRGEIERQIAEEPDVDEVRAGLLLDRSNVLQIQLRVRLRGTGATFDMQMGTANGQIVEL